MSSARLGRSSEIHYAECLRDSPLHGRPTRPGPPLRVRPASLRGAGVLDVLPVAPALDQRDGVVVTPQSLIYSGAGRPTVRGPDGEPLRQSDLGRCALCHESAKLRVKDCLSSNYVVAKQLVLGSAGLCIPCGFALRDLRLRCAPWIATPDHVSFCLDRWGILDFLLSPPEPPFVAGLPWFGIGKGGLGNWRYCRVWHPGREQQELCPAKTDDAGNILRAPQILPKLQSKHTAIFAQTALSRDRYPLAIDDSFVVMVDVELWGELAGHLTEALRYLPVPCLEEWIAPHGGAEWREGIIRWRELTAPLEPYRKAAWWPYLLAIVPRPERPGAQKPDAAPAPSPKADAIANQLALF